MISYPSKTWDELDGLSIAVFDWEANGFLKKVSKTFCGTVVDVGTRKVTRWVSYNEAEVRRALDSLDTYDVLVGQNLIGYDFPVLFKLYGWKPKPHVIILDTLWMSRMYNPDLEGGHSLAAWGERLGNPKTEYYPIHDPLQAGYDPDANPKDDPGWDNAHYTDNMGKYCDQDTLVNLDLFNKLLGLLVNFSWRSIICEMQTAVIIQRQMEHGFVFDYQAADMLHAKFMERQQELEDIVHETFKPLPKLVRVVQPKARIDGSLSAIGLKKLGDAWADLVPPPEYLGDGAERVYTSGSFSLIEFPEFSLGSRQQIAERLVRGGYKLTKFTPVIPATATKPEGGNNAIIDDSTLDDAVKAGIEEAKPLAEYFMITKREGMVKDWLRRAVWHEDEGVWRIHGFVNSIGAVTNRMTHNSPNVGQVPSSGSPYGTECRALFTVPTGYTLVGCDADGLELRGLSHYMGDDAYRDAVVSGDVHWVNTIALALIPDGTFRDKDSEHHEAMRDLAKTFIYAWLYGAGIGKVAGILGVTMKVAKQKMESFLDKLPALKKLREKIKDLVEVRSWLKGIDGRILRVRMPHAALNTILQGMGAIVMKYWLIEVARNADKEGLDWNPVANIHDEGQFEVLTKDVPRFKEICEAAFPKVSEDLNLFCPLSGTAMEGLNWSKTH